MFLCKDCHGENEPYRFACDFNTGFGSSYGGCESCHKGGACADCHESKHTIATLKAVTIEEVEITYKSDIANMPDLVFAPPYKEAPVKPITDLDQFYVAYLTHNELQTLYRALDCYEMHMQPLSRKDEEEIAVVTDALKEAVKKGKNFLKIDV